MCVMNDCNTRAPMMKIGVSEKSDTDSNNEDSYMVKERKTGAQNLVAMQSDKQFTT